MTTLKKEKEKEKRESICACHTDGQSINCVLAFRFIAVEDLEVLSPQVQHLGIDRSNDEIRDPNAVNPSNEAHVSTSALKRESVYDMKERVMLGDIGSLRDRTLGSTYNPFGRCGYGS